jgi:hypothetical protein
VGTSETNAQILWRRLRDLERNCPWRFRSALFIALFHQYGDHSAGRKLAEAGLARDLALETDRLDDLLRGLFAPYRDPDVGGVHDDVYAAALWLRVYASAFMPNDRGKTRVYRGQNDAWRSTPSIHRSGVDIPAMRARLSRFAEELAAACPQFSDDQIVALAQHYHTLSSCPDDKGDPKLATPLVDCTSNPYVALFFASYGGKEGRVGEVSTVNMQEWHGLLRGIAKFDFIRVPGVLRISRQRALFLRTDAPALLDEYSPSRLHFYHREGLVFTDPELKVTEDYLLPDHATDPTARWVCDWASQEAVRPRAAERALAFPLPDRPRLDVQLYKGIALNVLDQRSHDVDLRSELDIAAERVAAFHVKLLRLAPRDGMQDWDVQVFMHSLMRLQKLGLPLKQGKSGELPPF